MKLSVNLATGNPEHFLQDRVLFEFSLLSLQDVKAHNTVERPLPLGNEIKALGPRKLPKAGI